jgi:hypothetical protein
VSRPYLVCVSCVSRPRLSHALGHPLRSPKRQGRKRHGRRRKGCGGGGSAGPAGR